MTHSAAPVRAAHGIDTRTSVGHTRAGSSKDPEPTDEALAVHWSSCSCNCAALALAASSEPLSRATVARSSCTVAFRAEAEAAPCNWQNECVRFAAEANQQAKLTAVADCEALDCRASSWDCSSATWDSDSFSARPRFSDWTDKKTASVETGNAMGGKLRNRMHLGLERLGVVGKRGKVLLKLCSRHGEVSKAERCGPPRT